MSPWSSVQISHCLHFYSSKQSWLATIIDSCLTIFAHTPLIFSSNRYFPFELRPNLVIKLTTFDSLPFSIDWLNLSSLTVASWEFRFIGIMNSNWCGVFIFTRPSVLILIHILHFDDLHLQIIGVFSSAPRFLLWGY